MAGTILKVAGETFIRAGRIFILAGAIFINTGAILILAGVIRINVGSILKEIYGFPLWEVTDHSVTLPNIVTVRL